MFGLDDWMIIFLAASVYAAIALVLNRTVGERKKLQAAQKKMNDFQKEYKEATKTKDQTKLKELEGREKEIMNMTKDMMILPFKAMIFILPTFFIAIWLVGGAFPGFVIKLPVALHVNEILSFNILRDSIYGVRGYFIISAAVVGMILELIWSQVEKIMKKNQLPAPAPQPNQ